MIVLLGASGYIGQAFVQELARRQKPFLALSRSEIKAGPSAKTNVLLQIAGDAGDVAHTLEGGAICVDGSLAPARLRKLRERGIELVLQQRRGRRGGSVRGMTAIEYDDGEACGSQRVTDEGAGYSRADDRDVAATVARQRGWYLTDAVADQPERFL